jgi:hypothetical protein
MPDLTHDERDDAQSLPHPIAPPTDDELELMERRKELAEQAEQVNQEYRNPTTGATTHKPPPTPESLYALASRVQEIEARVRDGEELTEDLEQEFDKAHGDLEDKVRAVGHRYWQADRELAEQAAILAIVKERHDRAKRVVQRFGRYIGTQLARADRTVDGAVNGVPITWGSKERTETVVPKEYYENPDGLPVDCFEALMMYAIDKRQLRKYLEGKLSLGGEPYKAPDGVRVKRWHEVKIT